MTVTYKVLSQFSLLAFKYIQQHTLVIIGGPFKEQYAVAYVTPQLDMNGKHLVRVVGLL